jgi:hypothetical protein
MNSIQFITALHSVYPQITRIVDDKAYDADGNEVAYDKAAVQAYVDAHAYISKRAQEYPSIGDQLDALWKGGAEAEAMLAKVQAVKNKYPKGAA